MKVRNIVLLGGLLILFLLLPLWWLGIWRMPFVSIAALEAVPHQNTLILEIPDWQKTRDNLEQASYSTHFSKDPIWEKLAEDLNTLKKIWKGQKQGSILATLQLSGARQLDFLYLVDLKQETLEKAQMEAFFKQKGRLLASQFRGRKIYNWRSPKGSGQRDWSFCIYRNILLFAPYSLLIEEAIDQLKSPRKSLMRDRHFAQVKKSLTPGAIHLYWGLHNMPSAFSSFFQPPHRRLLRKLETGFSWLGCTVDCHQDRIDLAGKMAMPIGPHLLQQLSQGSNGTVEKIASILPENTALCNWIQVDDWPRFYREDLDAGGEFKFYFHPWLGQDMAYVITEPYSKGLEAECFVAFQTLDADLAKYYLEKYAEQKGVLQSFDYQSYTIRQVLAVDLLRPVFGETLNNIHNPYITQIGDYVIFGNSRQSLEVWIDKYLVGQTLGQDIRFLQWQSEVNAPCKALLYIDPNHASRLLLAMVQSDLRKAFQQNSQAYLQLNQLAVQVFPAKKDRELAIKSSLFFGEQKQNQTTIMWKTRLGDTILRAPESYFNPQRNAREILVQDQQHVLYVIDQGGDIRWKRALDEPLLSSLSVIDYYQNGQVQLLFNTASKIYLLDDEGQDVATFPLHLQSPAQLGMTVVDFQKSKDYAFFVACENGNIYGFNQTGSPLPGWNPRSGIGEIKQAIQHFVFRNKDYITVLNRSGKLQAFKRDGTPRFKAVNIDASIHSPWGMDVEADRSRLVMADDRGRVSVVNHRGELFHLNLQVGKNDSVQFCFSDIIGDQRKDYIALDDKDLAVYAYTKDGTFEALLRYAYAQPPTSLFAVAMPGRQQQYIGSLQAEAKQINLQDNQGKTYPGFPLAGSTPFEVTRLFGNDQNVLVVANGESVYAYKLQ